MTSLYQYPFPPIDGWMANQELKWIFETALEMESAVEIGVWKGRATHALCSACKGMVYAVDHFRGSPSERKTTHREATEKDISEDFIRNVGHFKNLELLRMESVEASKQFKPKSIDMVFIDGSHDYEDFKADFNAWLPICKKIICGHDFGYEGPSRILRECGLNYSNEVGSIWSVRL